MTAVCAARDDLSLEIATDAADVHRLLCVSDAHQARQYGLPAPVRQLAGTQQRVEAGLTWVLRWTGETVATFTIRWSAPFPDAAHIYPHSNKPAYLERLAVSPAHLTTAPTGLFGARCLRSAVELAQQGGADMMRAEANPDLTATYQLLRMFGFVPVGAPTDNRPTGNPQPAGLRRIYLQKPLREEPAATTTPTLPAGSNRGCANANQQC
jgi:hypothetical protein